MFLRYRRLTIILALASTPAGAAALAPADAAGHVGQSVTVEGIANVYTPATGKVTFVDLGGSGRSAAFSAVIFESDASKFSTISSYNGKKVDVSGTIQLYQGKPEIILKSADQLRLAN